MVCNCQCILLLGLNYEFNLSQVNSGNKCPIRTWVKLSNKTNEQTLINNNILCHLIECRLVKYNRNISLLYLSLSLYDTT